MEAAGFSNVSKETLGRYPEAFVTDEPVDIGTRGVPRSMGLEHPATAAAAEAEGVWGEEVTEEAWLECFSAERRPVAGGSGM